MKFNGNRLGQNAIKFGLISIVVMLAVVGLYPWQLVIGAELQKASSVIGLFGWVLELVSWIPFFGPSIAGFFSLIFQAFGDVVLIGIVSMINLCEVCRILVSSSSQFGIGSDPSSKAWLANLARWAAIAYCIELLVMITAFPIYTGFWGDVMSNNLDASLWNWGNIVLVVANLFWLELAVGAVVTLLGVLAIAGKTQPRQAQHQQQAQRQTQP